MTPLVVYLIMIWNARFALQEVHSNNVFYSFSAKGDDYSCLIEVSTKNLI
jgi:hypothetical protein